MVDDAPARVGSIDHAHPEALDGGLLGGTDSGPKTYLILVENEDELRPTGGFITAVGKVVIWNGQLVDLNIADSYSVDDINKAYPAAPWQMQDMKLGIILLIMNPGCIFTLSNKLRLNCRGPKSTLSG